MKKAEREKQCDRIIDALTKDAYPISKISSVTGIPEKQVHGLVNLLMAEGKIGKIIGGDKERFYYKKLS